MPLNALKIIYLPIVTIKVTSLLGNIRFPKRFAKFGTIGTGLIDTGFNYKPNRVTGVIERTCIFGNLENSTFGTLFKGETQVCSKNSFA